MKFLILYLKSHINSKKGREKKSKKGREREKERNREIEKKER